jgi:putative glutamine amidotransferase
MLIDSDRGTKRLFEEFIEAANQFHNAAALA